MSATTAAPHEITSRQSVQDGPLKVNNPAIESALAPGTQRRVQVEKSLKRKLDLRRVLAFPLFATLT